MKQIGTSIFLGLALAVTGCNNVDKKVDCAKICNEYQDCYDDGYDVDACEDRCEDDSASSNTARQDKADACESCIDDKSCTSQAFECETECDGIIP